MLVIKINALQAMTVLGVHAWEKEQKRPVVLNIELHVSDTNSGNSDNIHDTVDYDVLSKKITEYLEQTSYNLIEKLVTDVGNLILSLDKKVTKVVVEAEKAGAIKEARSISVKAEFIR